MSTRSRRHWVAFAASCAERLLPQYVQFCQTENWGDAGLLRQALDEAWKWAGGAPVSRERIRDLEAQCQTVIPNTEEFSALLCSHALDAGVAVCETLQLCMGADLSRAVNVASAARDTVDMYIQERDQMECDDQSLSKRSSLTR